MDVLKVVTFNDIHGNVCSLALIKFEIFIFCHIDTQSNPELEYAESHVKVQGCFDARCSYRSPCSGTE